MGKRPPKTPRARAYKQRAFTYPFDPAVAEIVLSELAGGCTLNQICRRRKDEGFPKPHIIRGWTVRHPDFAEQYARARNSLLDHWADELVDISDDSTNDYMERLAESGKAERYIDHENIQRSRLRVDTRKWLLSKLAPREYGDKTAVELSGKNGGAIEVKRSADELSDAELAAIASRGRTAPAEPEEGED